MLFEGVLCVDCEFLSGACEGFAREGRANREM